MTEKILRFDLKESFESVKRQVQDGKAELWYLTSSKKYGFFITRIEYEGNTKRLVFLACIGAGGITSYTVKKFWFALAKKIHSNIIVYSKHPSMIKRLKRYGFIDRGPNPGFNENIFEYEV